MPESDARSVALELCEQGGGDGLSRSKMDSLVAELFSTSVSVDTVLVTVFPVTVET